MISRFAIAAVAMAAMSEACVAADFPRIPSAVVSSRWSDPSEWTGAYFGINGGYSWARRSEEHTSELQSRGHLVCRLLLEQKLGAPVAVPKLQRHLEHVGADV